MEQVYIETQDLSVGYHGKALLKDIALKVKKGEILVLIGPNGAGKSTILKNIIREMQPISGGIYIKEKNVKDFTSKQYAKTMSVVLTEKIKTEMMTCRDVVAMGACPATTGAMRKMGRVRSGGPHATSRPSRRRDLEPWVQGSLRL